MAIINERTNGEIMKHDLNDLAKERNLIHVALQVVIILHTLYGRRLCVV
jgi:hypothetical protein